MKFTEKVAEILLADPRYVGAINQKMVNVWRTRAIIPNQYFNPRYVALSKKGDPKKEQVYDRFFNPKYSVKFPLNDQEKKLQDKIISLFGLGKLSITEVLKIADVPELKYKDCKRKDDRQVDLRSQDLLSIKKVIQELRIKIRKLQQMHTTRTSRIVGENEKALIDEILTDKIVVIATNVKDKTLRSRLFQRKAGASEYFENVDADYYMQVINILYFETQL